MFNWLISKLYRTKVEQISALELSRRLDEFLIIDVRTSIEWHTSHIPNAYNHPVHAINTNKIKALALVENRPVVVICLSAHRSTPVAASLTSKGVNAYELKGGMLSWWQKKLPTEKYS